MTNCIDQMTHYAVLTYPREFPTDGVIVKEHLHKLKLRLDYRGVRTFWFMEFQRRGAVHFNLLLDKEVSELDMKLMWYEIVGSGNHHHLKRGAYISPIKTKKGMLHYLTSYLTKIEQKRVPDEFQNVGRFWGYSLSLCRPTIKLLIGSPADLQILRRKFRPLRRWSDKRRKIWKRLNKGKLSRKLPVNSFARPAIPGQYLTIPNARLFIEDMKTQRLDISIFEAASDMSEKEASAPAPLGAGGASLDSNVIFEEKKNRE